MYASHWRAHQDVIGGGFHLGQHTSRGVPHCRNRIEAEGDPGLTPTRRHRRWIGESCLSAEIVIHGSHDLALGCRFGEIQLDSEQGPASVPNQITHCPYSQPWLLPLRGLYLLHSVDKQP